MWRRLLTLLRSGSGKTPETSPAERDSVRYARERQILETGRRTEKMTLAANTRTHREILYYLSEDSDPAIRKAAAGNNRTPLKASEHLSRDEDVDVRLALAERLVRLLPDLDRDRQSRLYAFAVSALGDLALDEVLKVRIALSSALKDHAHTPPKVAAQLARDVERQVSEPILRFCTALSDQDLLEVLAHHPASWAVQAIAARREVSPDIAGAVIETGDVPAGTVLLENPGAELTPVLLEDLVRRARSVPEWHKPLAHQQRLPPELARQMAEFVDEAVRGILINRRDFDPETVGEIAAVTRRRVAFSDIAGTPEEDLETRLDKLESRGMLNGDVISDAIGMRETDLVTGCLARLAKTSYDSIDHLRRLKAPKAVVALAWQCGLSMRMAYQLQKEWAQISPRELLNPRGGDKYPLSKKDMQWQLSFLGLQDDGEI